MDVYDPLSIFFFLLFLGILYIPIFLIAFAQTRLNALGILLAFVSAGCYIFIAFYTAGAGIYADEEADGMLFGIGFLELTLLAYPYIFIILAVLLGKKTEC